MSEKPPKESRRREFNVDNDRTAMPFLWFFGYVALAVGLTMLIAGMVWNLPDFFSSSLIILVTAGIVLRIAFKGRQQIKESDAQKSSNSPTE